MVHRVLRETTVRSSKVVQQLSTVVVHTLFPYTFRNDYQPGFGLGLSTGNSANLMLINSVYTNDSQARTHTNRP